MPAYEPGEEIQLDVKSKRKFFAKAMSWREQRNYANVEKSAKQDTDTQAETEAILKTILTRLTRTEPPIELTAEALGNALDFALIWELNAALKYNLTYEEKKS